MPHSIQRWLIAISLSLALCTVALALWISFFSSARAAPTIANTTRYCSNFDFLNNTGQDVNGLHVRLKGVKNIGSTYNGPDNPFGTPDNTSGYITATDTYNLNFSGGTAFDSDLVHIGLCSDAPVLLLDQQSGLLNFYWTQDVTQVLPNPLFTGLQWEWLSPSQLRIHVVNGQPYTTTLVALNLLDAGVPLTLDDLKDESINNLPAVLIIIDTPQTLAPQSESFFDISFSPSRPTKLSSAPALLVSNHPYVVQADLAVGDDLGNTARLFAQGLSPQISLFLPLITR